jgi:UDP-N-acetylmuramoyl-L-alanyl-D-glutamate--2,6-diaminopimelate ligase
VPDEAGRVVLVDYAHSDDALARALEAVRAAAGGARLICVFGCGGDRDKGKRPLMGRAAGERADLVVATSDNPRSEDPRAILAQIEPGFLQAGCGKLEADRARKGARGYCVEPDRRAAIELAAACARNGDAVLIAGKGHESYQVVGTETRPFDDRVEARRALAQVPPAAGAGK